MRPTRTTSRAVGQATALAFLIACFFVPGTASAGQIVWNKNGEIWAMNDDGSDKHPLVSAAQIPGMRSIGDPDVFANGGEAVVFVGENARRDPTNPSPGACGQNCLGVYKLQGGVLSRLSGNPAPCDGVCTTFDADPRITADSRVVYHRLGFTYYWGSCAPFKCISQDVDSLLVRPLAGGTPVEWNRADPGASSPEPAPDPSNAGRLAYIGDDPSSIHITNQSASADFTSVFDDDPRGVSWRPDGGKIVDTEGGTDKGLWVYNPVDSSTNVFTKVLNDTTSGSQPAFSQPRFMGNDRIVFARGGNLWSISAACTAATCSFPASATQLTNDGQSSEPSWTSSGARLAAAGSRTTPPGGDVTPQPNPQPGGGRTDGGGDARGGGGTGARCTVPKLKGKKLKAAKRALKRANCRLGKVKRKRAGRSKRGRVIAQKPKPGTRRARGAKVGVTVGR